MKTIMTVPGYTKPQERTKAEKNSKTYEQQITNIAKLQISEAIKIISYYLNALFLFQLLFILLQLKLSQMKK